MRILIVLMILLFNWSSALADQTCHPSSFPPSTPSSRLVDNSDGTITDQHTGLMWKQCAEGISGNSCENGNLNPLVFTWLEALKRPGIVNAAGGFAGHSDWRLPNIKELLSIVEVSCFSPAINLERFPHFPNERYWSSSPVSGYGPSWILDIGLGENGKWDRDSKFLALLVRDTM